MALKLFLLLLAIIQYTKGLNLDLDGYFNTHQSDESQERVVGGAAVDSDEYIPYQVSMQYRTRDGKNRHFCGGSIIAPNRILTAAHCVKGQNATFITVVAGIRDLNDDSGQRSQVQSFTFHDNYVELETSDIAVLSIDPPLELDGTRVNKIDVSGTEEIGGGQEATLTGWGALWHFGQGPLARFPNRLQKLTYKTMTNPECKRRMTQLTDTEICAKETYGKGACNGDSGGPLVMRQGDSLKQIGLVSYGTSICASNSPDVYTRVSMFDDWIKEKMI